MNGGGEDTDDNVSEAAEGMRVGAVRFEAVTGTGEHQWKLIYLRHDVEKEWRTKVAGSQRMNSVPVLEA